MIPEAPVTDYALPPEEALAVLDTTNFSLKSAGLNTDDATILAHVEHAIRLGLPQVWPQAPQADRIVLVGSGPSLDATFDELRDLYFAGAKLVTMNGAYRWCVEHHLRPSAQIILDARASNARFLDPAVPHCRYLLASQCAPETFAAAAGRDVWLFHAAGPDSALTECLHAFYLRQWTPIPGGTTVFTRALALLRTLGYLRFDVFGVDSCWQGDQHHAFEQPENAADRRYTVEVQLPDEATGRRFVCSPWMIKQAEDFLQLVRVNGHQFLLHLHGDGLLAYLLQTSAEARALTITPQET